MHSLARDEIVEIMHILTEYLKRREKPGEHLKSLIEIGQIQIDTAEVYFSSDVKELIPSFYKRIFNKHQELLLFLKVFNVQLYERSDERLKIQEYIKKLDGAHSQKASSKPAYNQLLDDERRTTSSQLFTDQAAIKIDNTIIINYDLHELESQFRLGYKGIFAFAIVGEYLILQNYIIKRILKELDKKERYYGTPIEITISDIYGTIEDFDMCNEITNSLNDNQCLDIILILWNHIICQDKLSSIADNFLSQIHQKYFQDLQKKNRCLIIILANVSTNASTPCKLNNYIPLTVPQRFEIDDLSEWFHYKLNNHKIEEVIIQEYLRKLQSQQGHLTATYHIIINEIVTGLQRRLLK